MKDSQNTHRPLPAAWVDRIFAQMSAYYGNRFLDMWRNTDVVAVKAVWAEKLGGFIDRPDCLKYGLACLDERPFPPTLPEFIADCRRAPPPAPLALEHRLSDADLERNRQRVRQMAEKLGRRMVVAEP